jgi:hypothetical protein
MGIKQFLKPDSKKIVIFIILFIISTLARANLFPNHEVKYPYSPFVFGIPFVSFYVYPVVELGVITKFNFIGFVGNIIFWYFFSCLIFWFYDKLKKKPQSNRF